jgi:hypothetical protein
MKTSIVDAPPPTEKPVDVRITVTKFKEVLARDKSKERGTEFTMRLGRKHPLAEVKDDNLFIRPPGTVIRFTIGSSAGDTENYYPVGITFLREDEKNSGDRQRLGFINFPQSKTRMEGRSLSITDSYRDSPSRYVRYKFSVVIQRGSDGKIGIIDPGLIHKIQH